VKKVKYYESSYIFVIEIFRYMKNMIRANWFTCFEEHVVESNYKGFLIRSELEFNIGFFPGI